jgi:hypothetical protein
MLSSLKLLLFKSLKNALRFSDNAEAYDPGIRYERDTGPCEAFSCPWPPSSTFDPRRNMERPRYME